MWVCVWVCAPPPPPPGKETNVAKETMRVNAFIQDHHSRGWREACVFSQAVTQSEDVF